MLIINNNYKINIQNLFSIDKKLNTKISIIIESLLLKIDYVIKF
jgi:hypothetical protein